MPIDEGGVTTGIPPPKGGAIWTPSARTTAHRSARPGHMFPLRAAPGGRRAREHGPDRRPSICAMGGLYRRSDLRNMAATALGARASTVAVARKHSVMITIADLVGIDAQRGTGPQGRERSRPTDYGESLHGSKASLTERTSRSCTAYRRRRSGGAGAQKA